MIKKLTAITAGLSMVMPLVAGAVNVPSFYDAVFDGQTDAWVNPGDRVDADLFVNAEAGEVVHAFSTDFIGDGVGFECHDVNNFEGEQSRVVPLDTDAPTNTGDYGFQVNAYVADNMNEADAHRGNTACTGDSETVYNESDVVHVIPDSNGSSSSGSEEGIISQLLAQIASLQAQIDNLLNGTGGTGAPALPPVCTGLQGLLMAPGVYYGQSGPNVVTLQQHLIGNGYGYIITYGATGNYFSQTAQAVSAAQNVCN